MLRLTQIAYRAAERNLQLLIETCIGIAKQSLKAEGLEVPSDARQSFAKLKSFGLDPTDVTPTLISLLVESGSAVEGEV